MKKLHWFNLIGVLALAGLCGVQWLRNRDLNLEVNKLMKSGFEQETRSREQEKKLSGLTADLNDFRGRYTETQSDAKEFHAKFGKADRELQQLVRERDQLKESVTNWAGAVTVRDARLKESNDKIRELATELNASVQKFNELATNYSSSVEKYNQLATNYNSVVEQLNEERRKQAAQAAAAAGKADK